MFISWAKQGRYASSHGRHCRAFTRTELLAVLLVVGLLSFVAFGVFKYYQEQQRGKTCMLNLKKLSLSVKMEAGESYRFHMQRDLKRGGTKDFTTGPDTFRHFQALSNVANPKLLVCPSDTRSPAASFQSLHNLNISYFIGLKGDETKPDAALIGDRLFTGNVPLTNGVLIPGTNGTFKWAQTYHRNKKMEVRGNVGMADGSVWNASDERLTELLRTKQNADNPLSFPD